MARYTLTRRVAKAVKDWLALTLIHLHTISGWKWTWPKHAESKTSLFVVLKARWSNLPGACMLWAFTVSICSVIPRHIVQQWLEHHACELLRLLLEQYYEDVDEIDIDKVIRPDETILVRLTEEYFYDVVEKKDKTGKPLKPPRKQFTPIKGSTHLYYHMLKKVPRGLNCFMDLNSMTMSEAMKIMFSETCGFLSITSASISEIANVIENFDGTICFLITIVFASGSSHMTAIVYASRAKGFILMDNGDCKYLEQVNKDTVTTKKKTISKTSVHHLSFNNRNPRQPERRPQRKPTMKATPKKQAKEQERTMAGAMNGVKSTIFTNYPPIKRSDKRKEYYNVLSELVALEDEEDDSLTVQDEFEGTTKRWIGIRSDEGYKCRFSSLKSGPARCSDKKIVIPLGYEHDEKEFRRCLNRHAACFTKVYAYK